MGGTITDASGTGVEGTERMGSRANRRFVGICRYVQLLDWLGLGSIPLCSHIPDIALISARSVNRVSRRLQRYSST